MPATYSNRTAFFALTRASLQAIAKSPSAIVFGLLFPLIFILVFGFLGGGGNGAISVALAPGSDTVNPLYRSLRGSEDLSWKGPFNEAENKRQLSEGKVAALLLIRYDSAGSPAHTVEMTLSPSRMDEAGILQGTIKDAAAALDPEIGRRTAALARVSVRMAEVREYKRIDFILPGQLGFSLLAGSVFGTAFVFFGLRQTLVLKRFFATPVRREIIVLSEGVARMIFNLLTAIVIILVGHYAFGFTLVHGFTTFLALLGLSALGILVFMGFGFIVSSIAKNDSSIPPLANMITLPQFLLSGTFFPIEVFPKWLQPISRVLPQTFLNHAMRKVAFEGAGFLAIWTDVLWLGVWGVVLYAVAGRVFKWE